MNQSRSNAALNPEHSLEQKRQICECRVVCVTVWQQAGEDIYRKLINKIICFPLLPPPHPNNQVKTLSYLRDPNIAFPLEMCHRLEGKYTMISDSR